MVRERSLGDLRELTLPSSVIDFHFRPSFAVTSMGISSGCFFWSLHRFALQNKKYAVAGAFGINSFSFACVCVCVCVCVAWGEGVQGHHDIMEEYAEATTSFSLFSSGVSSGLLEVTIFRFCLLQRKR